MGEVRDTFKVTNIMTNVSIDLDLLIDTGAVLPSISRDTFEKLGFNITSRVDVELGDGTTKVFDTCIACFSWHERIAASQTLILDYGVEGVIGQVILEQMDVNVHCTSNKIYPAHPAIAYPYLKFK